MRAHEFIFEEVTQAELDKVEAFADRLWSKFGIDVAFTHHFFDRINDARNIKPISAAELVRLFKKEYERYGRTIAGMDGEAVMKDTGTAVNVPFAKHGDRLAAKTIMRKQDFKSPDPEYVVEDRLDEILKDPIDFESLPKIVDLVNQQNKGKSFSGHTNVMASETMKRANTIVVRFMDLDHNIQYHIVTGGMKPGERKTPEKVNRAVGLDAMNIIFHDAEYYLKRHQPVLIIAPDQERYDSYEKMANNLKTKINPTLNIQSMGPIAGVDGGSGPGFKIFETTFVKNNFGNVPLGFYRD